MPTFRDYVPNADALAVTRLKAAGAVLLGKTNVPLMLADLQSYNDIYGTTNNPWDLGRTPGGSSGGSSAALAAGFGALSIGSDIAGSLRVPAHFCGVYAHKPSFGLVPTRGHLPPPLPALPADGDLAVIGPLARTPADLTLLLDVMAGPDPLTFGIAHRLVLPAARHDRLADFRVLVLDEHPLIPTGSAVRAGVERVAGALAAANARVERRSRLLPDLAEAAALYTQLLLARLAARMPVESYADMRIHAAQLSPDDHSLDAARARGAGTRRGVQPPGMDRGRRSPGAPPAWLAGAVRRVRRGGVSDHPDPGATARPQSRPGGAANRHRRRRLPDQRPATVGGPGHHARLARHRHPHRPDPRGTPGRRPRKSSWATPDRSPSADCWPGYRSPPAPNC
jgi:Asp-tRNA(Asn)/Glu-tRNA(Gln) amidotransferase A subunit family amidase